MKKFLLLIILSILLTSCGVKEQERILSAASSGNPKKALKGFAKDRAHEYAQNPDLIRADLKSLENIPEAFNNLRKAAKNVWGEKDIKEPTPKEYVKYINNYKSRAIIDYEKGVVIVETADTKDTKKSLHDAIVMTLLMPHDPSGADLFNSNNVTLGGEPYLYNEVLDNNGEAIRWGWRANKFADYLIESKMKTTTLKNKSKAYYVEIPMVKKHENIRAHKYQDIVEMYAKKYKVDKKLIYAIIKTESDFNQYAISKSGAVGLMQIMPATAGADAYKVLYNRNGKPTREYLFDPKNNIEMGTVYIDILKNRYLKEIKNSLSKEYCVISAYNGGAGNVLKTFHSDRKRAPSVINSKSPEQVYTILRTKIASDETKRYLMKVTENKKLF